MSTENENLDLFDDSAMSSLVDSLGQDTESGPVGAANADGAPATPPAAAAPPVGALPDPYASPPKSWAKEYHDTYGKSDPALRKYIHQREEEALRGISQYRQRAEFGSKIQQKLQPFQELLTQHNVDPAEAFDVMLRAHVGLTLGDAEQKKQWAQWLYQNYGMEGLIAAQQAPAQGQGVPPEVSQRLERLDRLEQAYYADKRKEIEREVDAFAKNPENTYFGELVDDITQLISSGMAKNIAEAYEQAKWKNASVRAKVIAEMTNSDGKPPSGGKKEPQKANAPAPLRSSTEEIVPKGQRGSIDDTISEVVDRLFQ